MSNVKFYALGGLNEIGKNLYIFEVDGYIYIMDAGLKYPDEELLGIDNVYPNIQYLADNQDRIHGMFLTHGHDENIGAAVEILKKFNIGIYGSHFTISVLEDKIKDAGLNVSDYRLYRVQEGKEYLFGPNKIMGYFVSHSIPETLNYAIETNQGVFIYAPDFTFDVSIDKKYKISFDLISSVSTKNVIALFSGSLGVNNQTRIHNNSMLEYNVSQYCMKDKRVFFSMYSTDLDKLQLVIDICLKHNRRIAIIGRKTQKLVTTALNIGYFNLPSDKLVNLRFRDKSNQNKDKDLAIIVAGVRHEPYYSILRMCKCQDKIVRIDAGDEILFIAPPQIGCEKISSRCYDEVLMRNASYYSMTDDELRSSHADGEELKMLYNLLKPKYIVPICGEYRHQYVQKKIAINYGYDPKNIILLENGDVISFEEGEFKGLIDHIMCSDVLVDGTTVGDVNELVLKDREAMSSDGIIIISALINKNKKAIIDGPFINLTGVIKDDKDVFLNTLNDEVIKYINEFLISKDNKEALENEDASCNELLRSYLMNLMFKNTIKRPLIIPSIIEIDE